MRDSIFADIAAAESHRRYAPVHATETATNKPAASVRLPAPMRCPARQRTGSLAGRWG